MITSEKQGIHMIASGMAVPAHAYDNAKMSTMVETSDEWITSRTGIRSRFLCEEGESCLTLAVQAARNALENAGMDGKDIGMILVASTTSDYIFPSTACLVAKELGIGEDVMAMDISAACSGFLYGMELARNYLVTHPMRKALVIGAEQLSRIVDYTDRSTCVLFGDGAGAVLFEAADQIYLHHSGCDGNIDALNCQGPGGKDQFLHMKGNDVFRFAVTRLKKEIDYLIRESGTSLDAVDHVICHQANARIIDHVKKKYPGYEELFFENLMKYGNTSAASIPIAIHELMQAGKLKQGMKIICVGFGAGLTWGSTYLQV